MARESSRFEGTGGNDRDEEDTELAERTIRWNTCPGRRTRGQPSERVATEMQRRGGRRANDANDANDANQDATAAQFARQTFLFQTEQRIQGPHRKRATDGSNDATAFRNPFYAAG